MTTIYENTLKIIDVPGLGDQAIPTKVVEKQIKGAVGKSEYVLLYCISVAPDHSLNVADAHVMESLQRILGRDVWRKCIILLTFCDLLHDEAKEKYDGILKNHVQKINQLLKKVQTDQKLFGIFRKKKVIEVKSVVDINVDQELMI